MAAGQATTTRRRVGCIALLLVNAALLAAFAAGRLPGELVLVILLLSTWFSGVRHDRFRNPYLEDDDEAGAAPGRAPDRDTTEEGGDDARS